MLSSALIEQVKEDGEYWEVYDLDFLVSPELRNRQWMLNHGGYVQVKINNKNYKTNKVTIYGDNRRTLLSVDSEKVLRGCYIIIFDDGEMYVGSSKNLYSRSRDHKHDFGNNCHINKKMQSAFIRSNNRYSILQIVIEDDEDHLNLEQYLIDYYRAKIGDKLLNIWDLVRNYYDTPEYKTNMSRMLKEYYSVDENRDKLSKQMLKFHAENPTIATERLKTQWADPEIRAKRLVNLDTSKETMSVRAKSLWGNMTPEDRKEFIANRNKARLGSVDKWKESLGEYLKSDKFKEHAEKRAETLRTPEARLRASEKAGKPVICAGIRYPGMKQASIVLGINEKTVRARVLSIKPEFQDWQYIKQ